MYRTKVVEQLDRVEIKIDIESVWLNGKLVKEDELRQILHRYMKRYAQDFIVIHSPSSDISYGRYIEYLDIIYSVTDKLRDEMSVELYDKLYHDLSFAKERDPIRIKYPNNVVEWTSEEKRLINLMNEANKR